ncbi:MAG TPA: hypothetical protein VF783_09595, partial [Terriglobales bacterium]
MRRHKPRVLVRQTKAMDTSIGIYASLEEIKAEEYRYWQSRPMHERMEAVAEISLAACAMKGAARGFQDFK